ncbi:hypothetical protein C8R43DRAFT_1233619 [Mycena crocata]|nr:hypothetical protein C8R43DRAFT_1233619 [Mycena crocata]
MTSRVQKGGLIFKPVAKARPRAASTAPRQASTPAESHASVPPPGDAPTLATPSVLPPAVAPPSMPPPATVPVRAPETAVPRLAAPPQPVASSSRTAPIVIASGSRIAVPPVITLQPRNSPAPPVIASSSRAPPPVIASSSRAPPPVIASSSSRAAPPIMTSSSFNIPAPSPTLVNSTTDDSILDKTPPEDFANLDKAPPEDFEFPEDLSQLIPPSNPSTLGPPLTVDPAETQGTTGKKTRKRKKKEVEGDAAEGEKPEKPKRKRKKKDGEGEVNAGENSEKPKKARKKRVKKEAGETVDEDQPKPRRKRKAAKSADTADEDSPPRKKRKPKPPAFDPDADPGEELDPTVITMAELCADNGQGRISSKAVEIQKNHLAWKQQSREKRARMKALAERKKYGRVEDEEETANAADTNVAEADTVPDESAETIVGPSAAAEADEPAIADATGSGFDYSQDLTASRFTVQVRIGPNGETIIDEESLTVDRNEEVDTTNYVHVVESDSTKFVNSASYTKKCRGARWSAEETDLFFEALAQHGENYELLSLVLPGRSRTACKNKFKAEDKKDSAKITRLLNSCDPIDIKTLTRLTGRDFSGPVPIIRVPTPPPVPIPDDQAQSEAETPVAVRKRSRSRTLPSTEGVQIIGDANSYEA